MVQARAALLAGDENALSALLYKYIGLSTNPTLFNMALAAIEQLPRPPSTPSTPSTHPKGIIDFTSIPHDMLDTIITIMGNTMCTTREPRMTHTFHKVCMQILKLAVERDDADLESIALGAFQ